jgi:hypothetical protein
MKFRIITNGDEYVVQQRGWWTAWLWVSTQWWTYPEYVRKRPKRVTYETLEEADDALAKAVRHDKLRWVVVDPKQDDLSAKVEP